MLFSPKNISFYAEFYNFETFLAPGGASGGAKPSRAEPSRAEPGRAGPSRAEPSRAEPNAEKRNPQNEFCSSGEGFQI